MTVWEGYWLLWFVAVVVTFAIPETIAIIRKERGDTLSEQVWALLKTSWRVPLTITLIGGCGWLLLHMLGGY